MVKQTNLTNKHVFVVALIGAIVGAVQAIFFNSGVTEPGYYVLLNLYGFFFVIAYDGRHTRRLAMTSFIAAGLASIPAIWPNGTCYVDLMFLINSIALSSYIILSFHWSYHQDDNWHVNYTTLFYSTWNSLCLIIIALIFLGAAWSLISLSAEIFSLININIISTVIYKPTFMLFMTSLLFALGIGLGRQINQKVVGGLRWVLLQLCRYLLPFLAIIALIFLVFAFASLFLDVNPMSKGRALYTSIAVMGILFLNAVYQDGKAYKPYPLLFDVIVRCFIILLPIFAITAFIMNVSPQGGAASSSINEYINRGALVIYTLAYAIAAIVSPKQRFSLLPVFNIILSLIYFASIFLTNNMIVSKFSKQVCLLVPSAIPKVRPQPRISLLTQAAKLAKRNQQQMKKAGIAWQAMTATNQHSMILAGFKKNKPLYVCRAKHQDSWHPGQLYAGQCKITYAGKVFMPERYQVLTGIDKNITWVNDFQWARQHQVRVFTIAGGHEIVKSPYANGEDYLRVLSICRTIYHNQIHLGKVVAYRCNIAYQGQEIGVRIFQTMYGVIALKKQQ